MNQRIIMLGSLEDQDELNFWLNKIKNELDQIYTFDYCALDRAAFK